MIHPILVQDDRGNRQVVLSMYYCTTVCDFFSLLKQSESMIFYCKHFIRKINLLLTSSDSHNAGDFHANLEIWSKTGGHSTG